MEAQVSGFQEIVISVSDIERETQFYQSTVGFEKIWEGTCPASQAVFWNLPERTKIEAVVLRNKGDQSGYIRLLKFHNVPQEQIRSSGHPWDTGGIFDINFRSLNLHDRFKDFQQAGWNGYSDPIRYQFGPFDVSEVILQGPDNVVIAIMERHAPPLEGFPNLKKLSHVFNSSQIVRDMEVALDFYLNKLGWNIYMQAESLDREAGSNVLGFPHNVNHQVSLPVSIVHPTGSNQGSLELVEIKGITGKDFADKAIPPNLGLLLYRFPVSDATAYANQLVKNGVDLVIPIQPLTISPYGEVTSFAVQSPDGVWIEFMEIL